METTESLVTALLSHLTTFVSQSTATIQKLAKARHSASTIDQASKTSAAKRLSASLLTTLQSLIDSYGSIFHKSIFSLTKNFQAQQEQLEALNIMLEQSIESLEMSQSIALKDFFSVLYIASNNKSQLYIGEDNKQGLRSGQGVWTDDKSIYYGKWKNGEKEGFGVQLFEDGSSYKGVWRGGEPQVGCWEIPATKIWKFFGKRFLKNSGEGFEDLMIGLRDGEEREPGVVNYLYYKGQKLGFSNLDFDQRLDLEGLLGVKKRVVEVKWMNGVAFRGYFKNFKPQVFGEFCIPLGGLANNQPLPEALRDARIAQGVESEGSETPKIENFKKTKIFYFEDKRAIIYSNPPMETLAALETDQKVRIEFLGGSFYEGTVTNEMVFEGFGCLGNTNTEPVGNIYGLFDRNKSIFLRFYEAGSWASQLKFLAKIGKDYFLNSERYLALRRIKEYPWLKFCGVYSKLAGSQYIEYKGGWRNFSICGDRNGYCSVRKPQSAEIERGFVKNGIIFSVSDLNLADYDLSKGRDLKKNEVKLNFLKGYSYKGGYRFDEDLQLNFAFGYGELTIQATGEVRRGYWFMNKLVFDCSLAEMEPGFDYSEMDGGHCKVKYKNGVTFDGYWRLGSWLEGEIIHNEGDLDEKREKWNPEKQYLEKSEKVKNCSSFDLNAVIYAFAKEIQPEEINNSNIQLQCFFEGAKLRLDRFNSPLFTNGNVSEYHQLVELGCAAPLDSSFSSLFLMTLSCRIPKEVIESYSGHSGDRNESEIEGSLNKKSDVGPDREKKQKENSVDFRTNFLYDEKSTEHRYKYLDNIGLTMHGLTGVVFNELDYPYVKSNPDSQSQAKRAVSPFLQRVKSTLSSTMLMRNIHKDLAKHHAMYYLQLTSSGLLRCTQDLFKIDSNQAQVLDLVHKDRRLAFAFFELNKLNGVAEVALDYIKFFNGDEYRFDNKERSYFNSLGTYIRASDPKQGFNFKKSFYWRRFLQECILTDFDEHFYEKEIRGKIDLSHFLRMNRLTVVFANQMEYSNSWSHLVDFGNGFLKYQIEGVQNEARGANGGSNGGNGSHERGLGTKKDENSAENRKLNEVGKVVVDQGMWGFGSKYSSERLNQSIRSVLELKENQDSEVSRRAFITKNDFASIKLLNLLKPLKPFQFGANHPNQAGFGPISDQISAIKGCFPTPESMLQETIGSFARAKKGSLYNLINNPAIRKSVYESQVSSENLYFSISYPNGDTAEGARSISGVSFDSGSLRWAAGYSYEGNILFNQPWGVGCYKDCMGVKRAGYFFKGVRLASDCGLEAVRSHLEGRLKPLLIGKRTVAMDENLIDIIFDADLFNGSDFMKYFSTQITDKTIHISKEKLHLKIDHLRIYNSIRASEMEQKRDLARIEDGEDDYSFKWARKVKSIVALYLIKEQRRMKSMLRETDSDQQRRSEVQKGGAGGRKSHNSPSSSQGDEEMEKSLNKLEDSDQEKKGLLPGSKNSRESSLKKIHPKNHSEGQGPQKSQDEEQEDQRAQRQQKGSKKDIILQKNNNFDQKIHDQNEAQKPQKEAKNEQIDHNQESLILETPKKLVSQSTKFNLKNSKSEFLNMRRFKSIQAFYLKKVKIHRKYEWILEAAKSKKISNLTKNRIIEYVKDSNLTGLKLIFDNYTQNHPKNVFKILQLENEKRQNLLMIAGYFGHRQLFLDILTLLTKLSFNENESSVEKSQIRRYLAKRDHEFNNVMDLVCQKGYILEDDLFFSLKSEDGIEVINDVKRELFDTRRALFSKKILGYNLLSEKIRELQIDQKGSGRLVFVTRRAICLTLLIEVAKKIEKVDFFSQAVYKTKMNNPMHHTLFHADLHATITLLRYDKRMLVTRNQNRELPPDIIRWTGANYQKASAVFATVLREFTRNYNFEIIKKLFGNKDEFLGDLVKKAGIQHEEVIVKLNKRRKSEILGILEKIEFDPNNVFLYHNNYILLSDDLCRNYVQIVKKYSHFRHMKAKHRMMKNYVFIQVSELEALQRNFLDYFGQEFTLEGREGLESEIRQTVKKILIWYVYIFGDVEINPRIYTLLKLNPFERITAGRNIFHFMCINNSYSMLKQFLAYFHERCHKRPLSTLRDRSREDWTKKAAELDLLEKFEKGLNLGSRDTQDTAGHFCVIHGNIQCLELLIDYGIDLEAANLRGRTIKEILEWKESSSSGTPQKIVSVDLIMKEYISYLKNSILYASKYHSISHEFAGGDSDRLRKILNDNKFSLSLRDKGIKEAVRRLLGRASEEYNSSLEMKNKYLNFMKILLEKRNLDSEAKQEYINELKGYYSSRSDSEVAEKFGLDKEILYFLITQLEHQESGFLTKKNFLRVLLHGEVLSDITHFKQSQTEAITKKSFLRLLSSPKRLNFAKPVPSNLKPSYSLQQLIAIEVNIKPNELVEDHFVVTQLRNIKDKYIAYDGGIEVEFLKGFPVTQGYCCSKKSLKTWYILVSISDRLCRQVASDDLMDAFNINHGYRTTFSADGVDSDQLEPLRHFQKVLILVKLIKQEFDIDSLVANQIIKQYFLVHDYKKRKALSDSWRQNKWDLHFKDAFTATRNATIKVLSLITFYHGIQQGFYFGFLAVYNNNLMLLGVYGAILTVASQFEFNRDLSVLGTSILVGLWSTILVNRWKRREVELAYSFDAYEEEQIKQVRGAYRGKTIIDSGLLSISKLNERNTLSQVIFTSLLFFAGFGMMLIIFFVIDELLYRVGESSLEGVAKTSSQFGLGILNAVLNFVLSKLYDLVVNKLVEWENHAYDEDMRNSLILKKVSFQLFSSIFTLCIQAVRRNDVFSFYTNQVMANLLTSALLNYGLSVGLPFFFYFTSRYHFYSYLLLCKWCCCKPREGRIEKFKKDIVPKMLADPRFSQCFTRYCMDGQPVEDEDLKKAIKDYKEKLEDRSRSLFEKEESVSRRNSKQNRVAPVKSKSFGRMDSSQTMTLMDVDDLVFEDEVDFEGLEKVQKHPDYEKYSATRLGVRKPKNISLRIKEEYTKYVLDREKIVETSYMLDLETLEESFHTSLLTQFTFVCFFSAFLPSAGLVSFLINLVVIVLTMRIYTKTTRRGIPRRLTDIGIWKQLYTTVGYLAVIFNAIIVVKLNNGIEVFRNFSLRNQDDFSNSTRRVNDSRIQTEIIYLIMMSLIVAKFLLGLLIPKLPEWIEKRINREKLAKERALTEFSKVLKSVKSGLKRKGSQEVGEVKVGRAGQAGNEIEGEEARSLKFFFENENSVADIEMYLRADGIRDGKDKDLEADRSIVDVQISRRDLL